MAPSTPLYRLKREARLLARREDIPLHQALDRIAAREGRSAWSLLMRDRPQSPDAASAGALYRRLRPGDLVLVAARPGQGKTLMELRLLMESLAAGRDATLFTLEFSEHDVVRRLRAMGLRDGEGRLAIDVSDAICASHVADALRHAPRGSLAVVDYLQLLDRRRGTPPLAEQMSVMADLARGRGLILVFLSQIDRAFDPAQEGVPGPQHVRLADPLDLSLFSKACFLHGGEMRLAPG